MNQYLLHKNTQVNGGTGLGGMGIDPTLLRKTEIPSRRFAARVCGLGVVCSVGPVQKFIALRCQDARLVSA